VISRVKTHPVPGDLRVKGIPPGTPTQTPMRVVYIFDSGMVATVPAESLITADGAPVYATRPGTWGQVRAAGRA
jgi:hypothetical protein